MASYLTITDPLIEPFFIIKDSYCYALYENYESEQGKHYEKPIGYYTNPKILLKRLAEELCRNKEKYNSVVEWIETFEQNEQKIKQILKL